MKTDFYTKVLLTIIAICLSIITLKGVGIFPTASANSSSSINSMPRNYGMIPINEDGSINVHLVGEDVLDVRLRGIDEASYLNWEAIKVKITE